MQNPVKKTKSAFQPPVSFAAAWLPAGGWVAFIFWASSIRITPGMYPPIPHLDKIFHTAEYWVYGCLVQRAATLRGWSWGGKRLAALMLILVGTGLLDEFYQKFIPTRRSDLADLMTDALAGTAGLLLYAWDARSR